MKWTNEQALAIEAGGNNILVAAAAGSGKTAVLVERIINKVLNQKINIDELLVVTFTNAAAAEMRERLVSRLYEKLEEGFDEAVIRKQLLLLNKASITTIHSFCLEVIRNNYFETDINPNFKIGDDVENYLLKLEALEEVFEKRYEEKDKSFEALLNTYSNYKNDEGLRNLVLFVYNFIQSSPFPFEWLSSKIEELNLSSDLDFSKTIWGEILINKIKNELDDMLEKLMSLKVELQADKNDKYLETVVSDILNVQVVQKKLALSWDELIDSINNIEFDRLKATKEGSEFLKEATKEIRDDIKSRIKKLKENICIISSKRSCDDLNYMYEILSKLQNLIKDFDDVFTKKKKDKNIIDFNDIEHYALKILVKKDNETNTYMPTEVAKKYKNKFKEILIDEYQDSNYIQEYILTQISNGKNMFMVGDVKQSIYRFRQARPDLFLNKYNSYSEESSRKRVWTKNKII